MMRKYWIAAAAAAQLAAQPALAAELGANGTRGPSQVATFAGARLRVPLGPTREKTHAGLALTATQRNGDAGTLRFSKGMEFGIAGGGKVQLSLGGRPVSKLAQGGPGPDGPKLGVSAAGWTAIGVGVVALAVGGLYIWLVDHHSDTSD